MENNSLGSNDTRYVNKRWGSEVWVHNSEKYCGKILNFHKDEKCSLHKHKLKTETFLLIEGKLLVYLEKKKEKRMVIMAPFDTLHIEPGTLHQMYALEKSKLIEFSTQHFDEDSYREPKGIF